MIKILTNDGTKQKLRTSEVGATPRNDKDVALLNLSEAIASTIRQDYITCWRDLQKYTDVIYVSPNTKTKKDSNIPIIYNRDLAGKTAKDHIIDMESWLVNNPFIKNPRAIIMKLREEAETIDQDRE